MKSILGIIFLVMFIVIVGGLFYYSNYNTLHELNVRVERSWKKVDSKLKVKAKIVKNIVSLFQLNIDGEKNSTLLNNIRNTDNMLLRQKMPDDIIKTNMLLDNSLSKFFVIINQNPDLKSNAKLTQLIGKLININDSIKLFKDKYNDIVTFYNKKITSFPLNLIASHINLKKWPYFKYKKINVLGTNFISSIYINKIIVLS